MARTVITRSRKQTQDEWKSILQPIVKDKPKRACLVAFKGTDAGIQYGPREKQYNNICNSIQNGVTLKLTRTDVLTFIRMFYRIHYKKELCVANTRSMQLISKLLDSGYRGLTEFTLCSSYVEWTYYYDKYKSGQYKDREFTPVLFSQQWMLDCLSEHRNFGSNSSFI